MCQDNVGQDQPRSFWLWDDISFFEEFSFASDPPKKVDVLSGDNVGQDRSLKQSEEFTESCSQCRRIESAIVRSIFNAFCQKIHSFNSKFTRSAEKQFEPIGPASSLKLKQYCKILKTMIVFINYGFLYDWYQTHPVPSKEDIKSLISFSKKFTRETFSWFPWQVLAFNVVSYWLWMVSHICIHGHYKVREKLALSLNYVPPMLSPCTVAKSVFASRIRFFEAEFS